jgi:hypothetical protein
MFPVELAAMAAVRSWLSSSRAYEWPCGLATMPGAKPHPLSLVTGEIGQKRFDAVFARGRALTICTCRHKFGAVNLCHPAIGG